MSKDEMIREIDAYSYHKQGENSSLLELTVREREELSKLREMHPEYVWALQSIHRHLDPGTCDSVESMIKIIRERDQLRAESERLRFKDIAVLLAEKEIYQEEIKKGMEAFSKQKKQLHRVAVHFLALYDETVNPLCCMGSNCSPHWKSIAAKYSTIAGSVGTLV